MLTVSEPLIRKFKEAPESDSAYLRGWQVAFCWTWSPHCSNDVDCNRWPFPSIWIRSYFILLVSFVALLFTLSATLLFRLDAVLLANLPPQGSACWSMNISLGILVLILAGLLAMGLMSVLSCVGAVSLLDTGLWVRCLRRAFDATTVKSLLQLFEYNTLEWRLGIGFCNIAIEPITLLIKSEAVPTYLSRLTWSWIWG